VVHYREPYAPYELQFIRGALPRHLLEGRDIDAASDYNRRPLGTGPYRVAEWKTGEYILLEKVPGYWRGPEYPRIGRILFKFIANTTTRVNQLRSGEAQVAALVPWDKYRELRDVPGLTIHRMMGNSYEHITLNQRQVVAFRDVRVRRALIHAIDRELLTRTVLDSLAPVIHGPIQPSPGATDRGRAAVRRRSRPRAVEAVARRNDSVRERMAPTGLHAADAAGSSRGNVARAVGAAARRRRGREDPARRRHVDLLALVRGEVRRDAALVAHAGRPRDHALLRLRPDAAGGTEHQLRSRRLPRPVALRVGPHHRPAPGRAPPSSARQPTSSRDPLHNVTRLDAVRAGFAKPGQPHQHRGLWNVWNGSGSTGGAVAPSPAPGRTAHPAVWGRTTHR
jgi:hypothetical protein